MYTTPTGPPISYKDLFFLWKTFLRENYLPYVVTQHKFKTVTQGKPLCMNLTLTQIPLLNIKHFWEKYVVFDEDASYDIQEIVDLYNQYERVPIQVSTMKAFLSVEYPQMTDQIPNIKCVLWDKEFEIETAMEVYKHHIDYSDNMDDMYAFYLEYTLLHHRKPVTKPYFEKHVIL